MNRFHPASHRASLLNMYYNLKRMLIADFGCTLKSKVLCFIPHYVLPVFVERLILTEMHYVVGTLKHFDVAVLANNSRPGKGEAITSGAFCLYIEIKVQVT